MGKKFVEYNADISETFRVVFGESEAYLVKYVKAGSYKINERGDLTFYDCFEENRCVMSFCSGSWRSVAIGTIKDD